MTALPFRPCEHPRCRSGLPPKFTARECAAFCWLRGRDVRGWTVDYRDKSVQARSGWYVDLIGFAQQHGWEG